LEWTVEIPGDRDLVEMSGLRVHGLGEVEKVEPFPPPGRPIEVISHLALDPSTRPRYSTAARHPFAASVDHEVDLHLLDVALVADGTDRGRKRGAGKGPRQRARQR
jgi:hypothetical protein